MNKDILHSLPYWMTQVIGDNNQASLQYVMDYRLYEPEEVVAVISNEEDRDVDEEAVTEEEQISKLKRFYIEKFEENVLREFYPGGIPKSETKVREEKRHGRYHEYHEDGKSKLHGKYSNN